VRQAGSVNRPHPEGTLPNVVLDRSGYRRSRSPLLRAFWFATICAASYAIGISLFFVIDGVSNFATRSAAGNPVHDAIAFVLTAIATFTLLAPLFQTAASRTLRTFALLTAIALSGFAILHNEPGFHVDAPLIYLNQRVVEPFARIIGA